MSESPAIQAFLEGCKAVGLKVAGDFAGLSDGSFPVVLNLTHDRKVALDLPEPCILSHFGPDRLGFAIVDHSGQCRATWGLATGLPHFVREVSAFDTALSGIIEGSLRGESGTVHHMGLRFFAAPIFIADLLHVYVLVADASEEQRAMARAAAGERRADTLKRVGKALTMNQTLQPLAVAAVHAIAAAAELAAVLLWTTSENGETLELASSVGINRSKASRLMTIQPSDDPQTAAGLAAARMGKVSAGRVSESVLTQGLETDFCYLRAGGLLALPLTVGGKLVGVLEVIGREADPAFEVNEDLFDTIAEHLSLALHSAMMFERAERLASSDPLTEIANHRKLQDTLYQRWMEAKAEGKPLAVVMLDVDHFRQFNETEGHAAGDKVLRLVANVLKSSLRPFDLAARYGGEEFTLILPGLTARDAHSVAESVRIKIEALEYVDKTGHGKTITASLGCASFPESGRTPAAILKAADDALYAAKRAGRNRTEVETLVAEQEAVRPAWARADDWPGMQAAWLTIRPLAARLARALGLSPETRVALEQAALAVPMWRRAQSAGDQVTLDALATAKELTSAVPALQALDERYDGGGPRRIRGAAIPLEARTLAVLATVAHEGAESLAADPGRFDPRIVALVRENGLAA